MCHESSGVGLTETIGVGKGTVKLEDFEHADSIFVIGQNPGTNHPRMLTELQKAARGGCKIVSVNPLRRDGDDPLQESAGAARRCWDRGRRSPACSCRCGSTATSRCLKGIMKEMLEEERAAGGKLLAHDFIAQHTEGFEALVRDLDGDDAGTRSSTASGVLARADRARRPRSRCESRADDLLLGDGDHPARERRRQRAEHRQLRAPARADRAARRGRSARCAGTATCRATARWASGRR